MQDARLLDGEHVRVKPHCAGQLLHAAFVLVDPSGHDVEAFCIARKRLTDGPVKPLGSSGRLCAPARAGVGGSRQYISPSADDRAQGGISWMRCRDC